MAIDGIASLNTGTTAKTSSSTGSTLASNFETFLTLLTTQLKNQNPLDPLDTNQFTQQLVQFAGVEQQLKTNDTLSALLLSSNTAQASAALNLVGKDVSAFGAKAVLEDGKATWNLDSPKGGVSATLTIRDSNGAVVFQADKALENGDQNFEWDGKRNDGSRAPNGLYTISVDAKDVAGNVVEVTSEVAGIVDGVDLTSGEAVLLIGDIRVPLGSLKSVRAPKADA